MPAGDRFVVVPAEVFEACMKEHGFDEAVGKSRSERVYRRKHHRDTRYVVYIYSSIAHGRAVARSKGTDAIRVCIVFEDGMRTSGVASLPKVLRTAPKGIAMRADFVMMRVVERAREAYAKINNILKMQNGVGGRRS